MRVALFVTCLVDNFYPEVGIAMAKVLAHCGVELDFPQGQTCCGQPAFNSGYADDARAVAATLLEALSDADYVVSPSGSCIGMIHHFYPSLFNGEPQLSRRAAALAAKSYEFSQFLVNILGIEDLGATFPYRVTYHPSCHAARLLSVRDEPRRLLERVRGLELIELDHGEDCCGFGGTFAVKMGDVSAAIVDEKVRHVQATGADVLTGTDMGCLMNIGGRLRRLGSGPRVMHIAELLSEGLSHAVAHAGEVRP